MPDADGAAIADTDSLEAVAKLTRTNRYRDVMLRVRTALEAGVDAEEEQAWTGPSEESPTYRYGPGSAPGPESGLHVSGRSGHTPSNVWRGAALSGAPVEPGLSPGL